MSNLSRKELIELVNNIMLAESPEEEIDEMITRLEKNVPYPNVSDLIFHPKDNQDLTAEEVIDMALSYKAIKL